MKTRTLLFPFLLLALSLVVCTDVATASPFAYITNACAGTVTVVNTANDTVLAPPIPVGNSPIGAVVNPTGTRVYVTNGGDNTVSVIDATSNKVMATINVGPEPFGIAVNPAGTRVYVANNGGGVNPNNTVSVIDTASNTVIATITVGFSPSGLAVNPAGTRLYVANTPASTLSVIDTSSNSVITTVPLSGSNAASGVVVNPSGTRVYVAGPDAQLIHVLDAASNTVKAEVSVPGKATGIALTPDGTRLYAALSFNADTVAVIDTANNSVVTTVPVSGDALSVAVTPDGTRAYVTMNPNNASVIDTATNAVVDTVSVSCPDSFGSRFIGPEFLRFPLLHKTASAARINSVFDHSMFVAPGDSRQFQYCADKVVEAYTGEKGKLQYGSSVVTPSFPCPLTGVVHDLDGFKQQSGGRFSVNGQYVGGLTSTDPFYLFYDGHPGYDYRTTDQDSIGNLCGGPDCNPSGQTPVLAAAAGIVQCVSTTTSNCSEGPGEIKIDHLNGYHTIYLHLDLNQMKVIPNQRVSAGQQIGVSDATGAPGGPHLHFEVRKGIVPVDPYGWSPLPCTVAGCTTDPYTRAVNVHLWK